MKVGLNKMIFFVLFGSFFMKIEGLTRVDNRVDGLRYFEFPQDGGGGGAGAGPVYGGSGGGGTTGGGVQFGGIDSPLVRQGGFITNGTVITIPTNTTFPGITPAIVNNQTCTCVPTGACNGGTVTPGDGNYGAGQIDVRIVSAGTVSTCLFRILSSKVSY